MLIAPMRNFSKLFFCFSFLVEVSHGGTTRGIIDLEKKEMPAEAVVLLGPEVNLFVSEKEGESRWFFEDGILTASPSWDSVVTPEGYQDFRMHVEFNVNDVPDADDPEKNGNSGVYIQNRYEVQILNSYGFSEEDYTHSFNGSLYRLKKPDALANRKAGEWQSYDIVFRAARFDGDEKVENARITVYQNGVLIHDDFSIPRKTGAGEKEGPEARPIKLQGHANEVRFRNIWIQRLALEKKEEAKAPESPKKKGYTYVIPFDEIPPAPALTPEEGLKSFVLHEDFEMGVVASDPEVQSPLAIQFDGDGRMWVVEMRAYMLNANADGEDEPIGRISILTDTNGDGVYDDYKVFMDGLNQPRSIAFYKNGILYGGHDKLYFVENVDDAPGKMTVIDPDYAGKGNVEHRANGLMRGLDNWIYNVKSNARYREIDGKWVKELTEFRGQWGITQNNYGRLFYNENWFGMRADQMMPNLLGRNPNHPKPFGSAVNISYRDKLYPARVTPGVNRGGEGDIDDNGHLIAATAACGPVVYRGDQFPAEYRNAAFFCEPAANLVRMLKVHEEDGMLRGETPLEEREFLASKDERFRPVNLFNAPDGSLFVVDLYHGIVQHKAYLTAYLREHIAHRDLESHPRLGRIYRVKYKGNGLGVLPQMLGKRSAELVPFLAYENGWWRDTAQQLIIDRGDLGVVAALNSMVADGDRPLGQIHALWTLEGLGAVNPSAISSALEADDPRVVEMAVRLCEELAPAEAEGMLSRLEQLAARPEMVVRRQMAASLGRLPGDKSLEILKEILIRDINQPFFREAAIHGLAGREALFQKMVGAELEDKKLNEYLAECFRIKTTASAHELPRNQDHLATFKRGEAFYVTQCMACHGSGGEGLEHLGPPLVNSEWVNGSHEKLAAILLQGMMGPIRVAGIDYDPPSAMPGLKHNPAISDADLADVATFIRHAWGNRKNVVGPETIGKVRGQLADRDAVFSAEELENTYP